MDDNVKDSRNAIWEDRIRDLIDSGKTQKIWCRDNDISESTLRYWLRKLRINPSEKINTIVSGKPHVPVQSCLSLR